MKVLLGLMVACLSLTLAHGACFTSLPEVQLKDGKLVKPDGCTDLSDNSLHPFGSHWNSAHCLACDCNESGEMNCCHRYGGVVSVPGCNAVVDPETCKYKLYKMDDPTQLCDFQL